MFERTRLLGVMVSGTMAGWLGVGGAAADRPGTVHELATAFDCWDCQVGGEIGCDPGYHLVGIVLGGADRRDGPTHDCLAGDCSLHAECFADIAAILDQVAPAVSARDVRRLAAISKKYPNVVSYNVNRRSYQVAGCDGKLIANIPVATE